MALFRKFELTNLLHVSEKKDLCIKLSSTNEKCSMETLVGGIIPLVIEKYEFDYRNKTEIFNNS